MIEDNEKKKSDFFLPRRSEIWEFIMSACGCIVLNLERFDIDNELIIIFNDDETKE